MTTKMRLALGVIIVAITGFFLFLLWPHSSSGPTQLGNQQATTTAISHLSRYVVPEDLPAYVQQMDEYTSSGGKNPALTWTYHVQEVTVPEGSTTEAYMVELAANQIKTGGGPTYVAVSHLTVRGDTAYVVLTIDEDGWAGVSFAINKIHPLVERTLLLNPAIQKVVFGRAPVLRADTSLQ